MIRSLLRILTDRLPCKVLRGPDGAPFLERYHLIGLPDGPGIVVHHFVASDPDRGFHDHPWTWGASLVLAGGYLERFLTTERWLGAGSVNVFGGTAFHRVLLPEGGDAWTLFAYGRRTKTWGFLAPRGELWLYEPYATEVSDKDGGWWRTAPRGRKAA